MRRSILLATLAILTLAAPVAAEPEKRPEARQTRVAASQRAVIGEALAASPRPEFLHGDHFFLITFDSRSKGMGMDDKLRVRFPGELTIVLQHDFEVIRTEGDSFTVLLHFDGVEKALTVPYAAVTEFRDPPMGLRLTWPGPDREDGAPPEG